ncbi:hypothetical protein [Streptomyces lavendulae]|uniref:hypothetical protein n=1 Tax=Streptomyces lavendulae TaxID=1914 RepID=UPI0024A179FE|nr:hypothetical protein [Streptomyces lavendulae]GLW04773.1 hypothetical protein Slala05_84030 [Streptomyces lavendulae subsp. lavendulae]
MYRIVRSTAYSALLADLDQARADLDAARTALVHARVEAETATDSVIRAEDTAERLYAALGRATATAARAEGELLALRPELLLDTEDRAALRMLLRFTRKQSAVSRVYALFHRGGLHSVHATVEAAEAAAEAEGAPPDGWTSHTPGAALPPAAEVIWRVQPLSLGGTT